MRRSCEHTKREVGTQWPARGCSRQRRRVAAKRRMMRRMMRRRRRRGGGCRVGGTRAHAVDNTQLKLTAGLAREKLGTEEC